MTFENNQAGSGETSIIDVHSHAMLDSWLKVVRGASSNPSGVPQISGVNVPEWNPRLAIEAMDQYGIAAMILSNPTAAVVAGPPGAAILARAMNDEMASSSSTNPRRFGAFAVLPLFDIDEALTEVRYALDELGFEGVCLQTNVAGTYLGDQRFTPLFSELNRRKTVAFIHPMPPSFVDQVRLPFNVSILEFMFETTRTVTSLIYSGMRARFPNFPIISTHAGGTIPFLAHRISRVVALYPTGYDNTISPSQVSEALTTFHFDLTAATAPNALASLLAITSAEKLLSGFDF